MAKTDTASEHLRKGAKVVARNELRDVPEGTAGKVIVVNGITWIRYWVRFDNGVALGTVTRSDLATPDEWRRHLNGEDEPAVAEAAVDVESGAGDDASGGGEGVTTSNGTVVPQLLIDRAKAARSRLAA